MGTGTAQLRFTPTIPPFADIQRKFKLQTGLNLSIQAELNLTKVQSNSSEILVLLQQDAHLVKQIEEQTQRLFHESEYERMSHLRDQKLRFNHIRYLQFHTFHFSPLLFEVTNNLLEIEYSLQDRYFLQSLLKTLVDLGGKMLDANDQVIEGYPASWNKLKPWEHYHWYNRPKR